MAYFFNVRIHATRFIFLFEQFLAPLHNIDRRRDRMAKYRADAVIRGAGSFIREAENLEQFRRRFSLLC